MVDMTSLLVVVIAFGMGYGILKHFILGLAGTIIFFLFALTTTFNALGFGDWVGWIPTFSWFVAFIAAYILGMMVSTHT